MGATRNLERLRARLAETPRNGQGHRQYEGALKRDVRQYARQRLRTGEVALNAVAEEIGISGDTLWGWLHKGESSKTRRRENALPEGARDFRAALEALGPRGPSTTYPPELRALALDHVKKRRDEGVAFREVASELGVGKDTLRHWIRPRVQRSPRVRRVSIATATPAAAATTTIVVHGPAGLRIEGLDVAMIAALLKELS